MGQGYMDFFSCEDYRVCLRKKQKRLFKEFGRSYSVAQIAQETGVQRTYLSAVFNGRGHLSSDQLFTVVEHLDLDEKERKFIELSHQYTRSSHAVRRQVLEEQMQLILDSVQQTKENLPQLDRVVGTNSAGFQDFYLEPMLQIIYVFLTIPKYQRNWKALSTYLRLSHQELQTKLECLVDLQLAEKKPAVTSDLFVYKSLDQTLHLEPDSSYCIASQKLMRLRTLEKMDRKKKDDYFFSASFTAGKSFQNEFKAKALELLEWAYKHSSTKSRGGKHVMHVNLDFFRWDA